MTIRPLYPDVEPTLNLDFANTKRLDPRITFSRASSGTYFGADGLLKNAAVNEARFDHSPSTGESLGLLVEEARTNSITYSERFSNAAWTVFNLITVPNSAVAPDGSMTAHTIIGTGGSSSQRVFYNTSESGAGTRTVSVYAKAGTNSFVQLYCGNDGAVFANFNLSNGSVGSTGASSVASIQALANGWYRCILYISSASADAAFIGLISSATAARGEPNTLSTSIYLWGAQSEKGSPFPTSYIPTPATFTGRASTATYYDSAGIIQTAASGVARSDAYFPDSNGVMRPAGLLLEAAGTNLVTYSEQFDNAAWIKGNCTITANITTAPDGTITADKLVEDTANNSHVVYRNSTLSIGVAYTFSAYVKAAGRTFATIVTFGTGSPQTQFFNLTTGQAVNTISGITPSITALPSGWYRIGVSFTSTVSSSTEYIGAASSESANSYTGDGTSGIFLWGAQLEASPYPTSYIPTTTATVTRAADTSTSATVTRSADVAQITGTNFSSWYNQSEGSALIRALSKAERYLLEIPSSNGANYNLLAINSARAQFASVNLTTQASIFSPVGTWNLGTMNTASFAYKQDSFAVCSNGSVAATDTSGTVPVVVLMDIGRRSNGANYSCSTISRLTYWPVRLADTTLQAITR